jgi:hypothetical protein
MKSESEKRRDAETTSSKETYTLIEI